MINYVIGDVTEPIGTGNKIIIHCVNDVGAWGAGVVLSISRKWKEPEAAYRLWKSWLANQYLPLGNTQFVEVQKEEGNRIIVANIVGQNGIEDKEGEPPVDYSAIRFGIFNTIKYAKQINASIHGPRLGSGLAGGEWRIIEKIINGTVETMEFDGGVTIYDLPI